MFESLLSGWSLPFTNTCLMIGSSLCEKKKTRQGACLSQDIFYLFLVCFWKKLSSGWSLPSVIVTRLFRSTELRDKSSALNVLIFFSEEYFILVVVYHSSYDSKDWLIWSLLKVYRVFCTALHRWKENHLCLLSNLCLGVS